MPRSTLQNVFAVLSYCWLFHVLFLVSIGPDRILTLSAISNMQEVLIFIHVCYLDSVQASDFHVV